MSIPADKDFLGSGIAFPFRVGKRGLPDLEFNTGAELVGDVIEFMLRTFPGQLPWDPTLGMDPEVLRFGPNDAIAEQEANALVQASIIGVEPRLESVRTRIVRKPSQGLFEADITYEVITSDTPDNLVVLPQRQQAQAVGPVTSTSPFSDALVIALGAAPGS